MIVELINLLKLHLFLKVPSVFSYYSVRMMLAALTSLLVVIFLGPRFILSIRSISTGQASRTEDCPLLCDSKTKRNTATMGGVLILFSMLIAMIVWMDFSSVFTLILFLTTLIFGVLGARDDYLKLKYHSKKGISGKKKLLCQCLVSGVLALYLLYPPISEIMAEHTWFQSPVIKEQVTKAKLATKDSNEELEQPHYQQLSLQEYASRYYMPFFKDPLIILSGFFMLLAPLLIIFVVTGSSNAVNLTDGLDGLASGCLIMVASCLALFAFVSNNLDLAGYLNILYIEGSGEIAIYLSALVGACIGFLWYNGYPAEVFMGDTGSLALGGIIGVAAVLLRREALLGVVGGIFVAETLSVIMQVFSYRYRQKKRIFLCTPLHHHFECKGWPETKVVLRFWIIGLLLAIIGMASLRFQ
jgi:phospho-N-acetylmuramoyl-pentapeptide-transferase